MKLKKVKLISYIIKSKKESCKEASEQKIAN